MALVVKGFINDSSFIDNNPNVISKFFELSDKGHTYARDTKQYAIDTYPKLDLTVFKAHDTYSNEEFKLDNSLLADIFKLTDLIKTYPINNIYPYNKINFINYLQVSMGNSVLSINLGDFTQHTAGAYYPNWFSFLTITGEENTEVKIYINNEDFLNNYDEYEILVVPALPNINDFNNYYTDVLIKLEEQTYTLFNERIEVTKGIYPNTHTRIIEFDFYNRFNPTIKTKTYWGIVIYGEAGNDIDYIKDAIEEYILRDNENARGLWEQMFPDIFRRTEFILLPLWHKIAINNLGTLSTLYSSMISTKEISDFIYNEFTDIYSESVIYNKLVIFPYDYKAITIAAIPGTLNTINRDELFEIFNDYIPVNTSSLDFMRMTELTRNWLIKFEQALSLAETLNRFTSLPTGFRRVIRGNRNYVGFYYNNINYLTAYRYNTMYD